MWYVAFNLGLLGGLHCIGMCGALSCAMCHQPNVSKASMVWTATKYQIGRTITYTLFALVLNSAGELLMISQSQQWLSIGVGVLMIIIFVFAIDIETRLVKSQILGGLYWSVKRQMARLYKGKGRYPTLVLGMINGLLPCGLVYLALAGALTSGSILSGMLFMAIFGMGTIPLMVLSTVGVQSLSERWKVRYQRLFPYLSLCLGIYLVYRGMMINVPEELDFWHAVKHPIMCFGR